MTKLGKLLVLLNVAFSFMMMAWALALLNNRIDWSNNPAKDDQPAGELAKRKARIDELWAAFVPAKAAWVEPRASIVALEKQRPQDWKFYAAEMAHLRTGATEDNPARSVAFEKGVPVLDPANSNRPKMDPVKARSGPNLQSMSYYEVNVEKERQNLIAEVEKYDKLVKEDTSLTVQLVGSKDPKDNIKGLRQRLIDERQKLLDLIKEQELARPLLINAYVESQLILKRAESLKARIEELERPAGAGVAGDK